MALQRTLSIIKPDAVANGVIGAIIARLEQAGLNIVAMDMRQLAEDTVREFYAEHQGRDFFEPLVSFMSSAPSVVLVLEGEDAVTRYRALMGATNSSQAAAGTLRADFGTDGRCNAVHGSDSTASAEREITFFFNQQLAAVAA